MKILLPLLCVWLPFSGQAQKGIEGLWEGTMTVGGIYSDEALPMQLYLTVEGNKVKGRSYVTLPDGEILRMDLEGYFYGDRSIGLHEVAFAGDGENKIMPEFNRKYQIVYKKDIWDSELRGFWQEQTKVTFRKDRRRGRMVLTKRKDARA